MLALSLLAKAGFDPAEGDDPLIERSAHPVPIHLLPVAELDPADRKEGQELLGSTEAGEGVPRKRGRGAFRSEAESQTSYADQVEAERSGIKLQEGVDPTSRITIRFALEEDKKHRKQATESEWYQRHGRSAGKETSERKRDVRENRYEDQFNGFTAGEGGEGHDMTESRDKGRELQRRIAREKRGPYARPSAGERRGTSQRGQSNADELDRELERFARQKAGEEVEDEPERRPSGRRNGSGRGNKDDLDKGEHYHDTLICGLS